MATIKLQTAVKVTPMIYAYTTPEIERHNGWTKIGYTEQDVDTRIRQQTHTADVAWHKEWQGTAIFDDGSGDYFKDTDFHAYLKKNNVPTEEGKNNEWFKITGPGSKEMFRDFKENRGRVVQNDEEVLNYSLRKEQNAAVEKALDYFQSHEQGSFLWNAKPRFGKTLAAYELCKRLSAKKVLIVTNRPAIANSWYDDYCKFLGTKSGYAFVSEAEAIKNKPYVISRERYISERVQKKEYADCIEFVSLQDLKGSKYFGGEHDKLREVADLEWDILIIDEAHEAIYTSKTDIAFNHIKRKNTLHLSGTPFKALANDVFAEDAIFNWTYADEQKMKQSFADKGETENPYANLPQLNMFTYQMSEIVKDRLKGGMELDGETVEFAFDLNEFFSTNENGRFIHNEEVNIFLDTLTTLEKFPFSTDELRNELKHTLWLLNRVDSAKALAGKLEKHPVFGEYKIILAAGDGKLDNDDETKKSFDKVRDAIGKYEKTITLSVGQLTTGVTIPEWTAVLMLSNVQSPALYMQAAFRAQNPHLFSGGGKYLRKKNAYIFDFDPARTLIIFEKFANDLCGDTKDGRGESEKRKANIKELLNFFPVIAEDENGEMVQLDAEKVLSIPRKIKAVEVVKRGFMSDFLFQNISNVFRAPKEIMDIIQAMVPAKEITLTTDTGRELSLDENGDVNIDEEQIIGLSKDIFGEKIFADVTESFEETLKQIEDEPPETKKNDNYYNNLADNLSKSFKENVMNKFMKTAENQYGADLSKSVKNELERHIAADAKNTFERAVGDFKIQQKILEEEKLEKLDAVKSKEEEITVLEKYLEKVKEVTETFSKTVAGSVEKLTKQAAEKAVRSVETSKKEKEKKTHLDEIKDHLRGFSRTIPSFLMAYGNCDTEVTLANFDKIVPADVFLAVTSITLENFRMLRDGADYIEQETGKTQHFDGHLFEPVVFDDSIKEFMQLKKKLANYFDEASTEDIFDYIPPQKNNQIFTPRKVVKDMADRLEKENPGCFDASDKTFADLYVKSGMYITEIVKRLYRSAKMKALFPDDRKRLNHIFANQVYALAPTEIIYRIALAYILGFSDEIKIEQHNIRLCDALECAKEGNLEEKLEELFGN